MARALRERRQRARRDPSRASRGCSRCSATAATAIRRHRPRRPRRGARAGGADRVDDELLGGVAAAMALVKAYRMHGHLAARLDPLGSEPVGDPALEPERLEPQLTPELQARIPARCLRRPRPRRDARRRAARSSSETYCGTIAYEIEHISDHEQRVWLRQAIESGRYRAPLAAEEKRRAARAPVRGRGLRALPAPRVPRPEAVLDRGPRRDGADARRGDRARRRRPARTRS